MAPPGVRQNAMTPDRATIKAARDCTAERNIRRVLEHLDVADTLKITLAEEARVWAWPIDDRFLRYIVLAGWKPRIASDTELLHGTRISYQEKGVRPAMQATIYVAPIGSPAGYYFKLDMDEWPPHGVKGELAHGFEIARNWITRRKTDQRMLAALLDKRFGKA